MDNTATDKHLSKKKLELVIIDDDPLTGLLQRTKLGLRFPQPLHLFKN